MRLNHHKGHALDEGAERRGWFIGHFMGDGIDIRATEDVEIKWGVHPAGDERSEWATDEYRTTIVLLIRGRFWVNLAGEAFLLAREGDYVMWGPGVDHSWRADTDSLVLTVRWPSLA